MNISDFKVETNQVSMFQFDVRITAPNGVVFVTPCLQLHPKDATPEIIINNFLQDNAKHNWAIEVESKIIKEEIKPQIEIKEPKIQEPQIAKEINNEPVIDNTSMIEQIPKDIENMSK